MKEEEKMKAEKRKQEREEFIKKQQSKLRDGFEEMSMKLKEDSNASEKKKLEEKLRNQMLSKKVNDLMFEDKKAKEK